MVGRIGFAWWNGARLDSDAKQWRLFADVLNDAAIFLELVSQVRNQYNATERWFHNVCTCAWTRLVLFTLGNVSA